MKIVVTWSQIMRRSTPCTRAPRNHDREGDAPSLGHLGRQPKDGQGDQAVERGERNRRVRDRDPGDQYQCEAGQPSRVLGAGGERSRRGEEVDDRALDPKRQPHEQSIRLCTDSATSSPGKQKLYISSALICTTFALILCHKSPPDAPASTRASRCSIRDSGLVGIRDWAQPTLQPTPRRTPRNQTPKVPRAGPGQSRSWSCTAQFAGGCNQPPAQPPARRLNLIALCATITDRFICGGLREVAGGFSWSARMIARASAHT